MIITRLISRVVIITIWLKKYKIPKILVGLYMMSMGHGQKAKGRKYGVYFISKVLEAGTSDSVPDGARHQDSGTGGESFRQ
jgi:hypothetical protein